MSFGDSLLVLLRQREEIAIVVAQLFQQPIDLAAVVLGTLLKVEFHYLVLITGVTGRG